MITARELDQPLPTGMPTGHPDGAHRGFGSGTDQSDPLHARKSLQNQLCDARLVLSRRAVRGAPLGSLYDRVDHLLVSMPENHRPPGADVVNKTIAIQVVQVRTLSPVDKQRMATDGPEGPCRGIDSPWNQTLGSLKGRVASGQIDFHSSTLSSRGQRWIRGMDGLGLS